MNEITPPVERPIEVSASAIPEQVSQAIRVLLVAVGGYMVGKGWLNADIVSAAIPVILLVLPLLWGQYAAKRNNAKQVTMANILPDQIAEVK